MTAALDISELITTRISHDIIGNIGAVANAVELLEEGDMDFLDDIRSILKTSSAVLSARLKFFRMVFGVNTASFEDKSMVEKTIRDYLKTLGNQNFPIELVLENYSPKYTRILMLSVMIMADVVIKGAKISAAEVANKLYVNVCSVTKLSEPKVEVIKNLLSGAECEAAQFAPVCCLKEVLKSSNLGIAVSDREGLTFEIE